MLYNDSSPKKSLNNTREKISCFFLCIWHAQSAADTSPAFRATQSGWWMKKSVGEENQNTGRKIKSYVLSGLGNGVSRGWEGKSTTGRFATHEFWPLTRKISSVGKDLVNKWEFSVLKITSIVCFWSVLTHFLLLRLSGNAINDFFSGIIDPFIFIH